MLRNRQALIPYLLLVAALAGGVLWHQSEMVPGLGKNVITGRADVGGPFRLIEHNGKTVTEADFRGRYMLIYFGYSFCPDVCPTTLAVMAQALEKLGGKSQRIVPIMITIDPERDTPQVLNDYMKAFGPTFVGLTGSCVSNRNVMVSARNCGFRSTLLPRSYVSVSGPCPDMQLCRLALPGANPSDLPMY